MLLTRFVFINTKFNFTKIGYKTKIFLPTRASGMLVSLIMWRINIYEKKLVYF